MASSSLAAKPTTSASSYLQALLAAVFTHTLFVTDLSHGPEQGLISFWKCVFSSEFTGHIGFVTLLSLAMNLARLQSPLQRNAANVSTTLLLLAACVPLRRLAARQAASRGEFVAALRAARIPTHHLEEGGSFSWGRLLALCLPSSAWLSFGIRKLHAVVYDTAPRRERVLLQPLVEVASFGSTAAAAAAAASGAGTSNVSQSLSSASVPLRSLKLDLLWNPRKLQRPNAPVLLYIHGGGWVTGHRSFASLALLYAVANAGCLVATINYRLAPAVSWPHMLHDVAAALAWLRAHADAFGGDPHFIVAGGDSAGGHLALMLGLAPGVEQFHRQPVPPPVLGVDGIVDLYGVTDWCDSARQYSSRTSVPGALPGIADLLSRRVIQHPLEEAPLSYVRGSPLMWMLGRDVRPALVRNPHPAVSALASTASCPLLDEVEAEAHPVPPLFIVHGDADTLVPVEDSRMLWAALQRRRQREPAVAVGDAPRPALDVFIELAGAHHAFNYVGSSSRTLALGDAVVDWLEHVHAACMLARRERGQQPQQQASRDVSVVDGVDRAPRL